MKTFEHFRKLFYIARADGLKSALSYDAKETLDRYPKVKQALMKHRRDKGAYDRIIEELLSAGFQPEPNRMSSSESAFCTDCGVYWHEVLPGEDKPVSPGDREAGRTYLIAEVRVYLSKPVFRTLFDGPLRVKYQGFPPLAKVEMLDGYFDEDVRHLNPDAWRIREKLFHRAQGISRPA